MPEYSPDLLSAEQRSMYDMMAPEERKAFDEENKRMVTQFNDVSVRSKIFAELEKEVNQIERAEDIRFEDSKMAQRGFWAEDEDDEFALVEDGDEEVNDDEITSMAHAEMEFHREMRQYARIAAWDMPMLSSKLQLGSILNLVPMVSLLHDLLTRLRYRTRTTLYPAPSNPHPPLPLHNLHG